MTLKPYNRHLLIELVNDEESEKESGILVPDDYRANTTEAYRLARLLDFSTDCSGDYAAGQHVLVETSMVKGVRILDRDFQLVLENYVLATVVDAKL